VALAGVALAALGGGAGAAADDRPARGFHDGLIARSTAGGQLRETVPIARHLGEGRRSVFSRPLPTLRRGDQISVNGEVVLSTLTCAGDESCPGRMYGFSPHLRARIVMARGPDQTGRRTMPVSRPVTLTCGQRKPNRNHHCPLVISGGSVTVARARALPCPPRECRLNMVVDAYNQHARGGEVVIVGADLVNGNVVGGHGRLNVVVERRGARVSRATRSTSKRLIRRIPASFDGGQRAVYSLRIGHLKAGDVLLVRARQRTAIERMPYFVGEQVVVATERDATHPSALTRRIVAPGGTATEVNGFNCTRGPTAFSSPCLGRKAGLVVIRRTPARPLFVILRSRGFPKLAQAKRYPPLRILRGGGLTVTRLRATGR
jgi:hypothetical protein